MLTKVITLKFSDGSRRVESVHADSEADFAKKIEVIMKDTGAYGFGTQSTVVYTNNRFA